MTGGGPSGAEGSPQAANVVAANNNGTFSPDLATDTWTSDRSNEALSQIDTWCGVLPHVVAAVATFGTSTDQRSTPSSCFQEGGSVPSSRATPEENVLHRDPDESALPPVLLRNSALSCVRLVPPAGPPCRTSCAGVWTPRSAISLQPASQIQVSADACTAVTKASSNLDSTATPLGSTADVKRSVSRHQSSSDCSLFGFSIPKLSAPRANRAARVAIRTCSAISRSAARSFSDTTRDMAAVRRSSALAIPPSSCASTERTSRFSSSASALCPTDFVRSPLAKMHLTAEVSGHH